MEKETRKILTFIKDREYSCGFCSECYEIEVKIDKIICKLKEARGMTEDTIIQGQPFCDRCGQIMVCLDGVNFICNNPDCEDAGG